MKKILLSILALIALKSAVQAQTITDTVSIGTGYANQVWYQLENGTKTGVAKNNWDIAFDCSGFGSSIHINSVIGTKLWKYTAGDTTAWTTLDTTGIASWPSAYNSDTSWTYGAFDKEMNSANPYYLGWGSYNTTTHIVTGDSIFVIKLANGDYKKIWIQNLNGGIYTFKYANIDGTSLQTATIDKANFVNKNFAYFSFQNNAPLTREPDNDKWDLLFTQYTTFIPQAYTVTGILQNKGVTVAEANNISNTTTYVNYNAHTFYHLINEIGYDWKSFNGTGYTIKDSLVYFVQTLNNDIWKVIPTGFGGSANGNFIFTKEKLASAIGLNQYNQIEATATLYPNPCINSNTTLLFNIKNTTTAHLQVTDELGHIVLTENLAVVNGLNTYTLNTATMTKGVYFITLQANGTAVQQKLILQ